MFFVFIRIITQSLKFKRSKRLKEEKKILERIEEF